jgi:hypothetical protein
MQQREMRRTIPSIQRANDDEFTPDQRSVWAGNLVSCSSLATLGHSSMPGIRSAPDALVDRQRQLDRASPEELLPNAWFATHSPLQKESRSNDFFGTEITDRGHHLRPPPRFSTQYSPASRRPVYMGRDPDKVRPWHRVRWVPGSAPLPDPRILGLTRKVTQHEILVVSEAPWPADGVFAREWIC